MILHVFDAQNNFINFGIDIFENAGIPGHYLYFGDLSNIKRPDYQNKVSCIKCNKSSKTKIQSMLGNYKLVLFHGLLNENVWALKQLVRSSDAPPFAWMIYGADLSNIRHRSANYLMPKTRMLFYKHKPFRLLFPVLNFFESLFRTGLAKHVRKVSYAVHFMDQEIKAASTVCRKDFTPLWFSYGQLEDFIGAEFIKSRCTRDGNILIGNSASYSSNHLEAFDYLGKSCDILGKKIYVPLSYGNKKYAKDISIAGVEKLGEAFIPLLSFLPREEYHEILLSCSCVIMNHTRQQALGNIIVALWLGSRVYINENISTYHFFKEQGIKVCPLSYLNLNDPNCFVALDDLEVAKNREVLSELFLSSNHRQHLRESFVQFI